jgi:hypothetical protein
VGGADEVLAQHVEHAAAGDPRDQRGGVQAEREGGKHEGRGAVHAGGGKPAQLEGEEQHEEQPQPEDRHRDAEDGEQGEHVVPEGAAADRGGDARREAEGERHRHAGERELQRVAEAAQHLPQHGLPADERHAEVANDGALQPQRVLHEHRAIEPELAAHALDVGDGRADPGDHLGGVAGDQVDEEERGEGRAERDRHQGDEPSQDEPRHRRGALRTSRPRRAGGRGPRRAA